MTRLLVTVAALALFVSHSNAQSPPVVAPVQTIQAVTDAMNNGSATPSWQAICGYKWRMYRLATGASGRDAYIAFMRTPSKDGGCGAGETTTARTVKTTPRDEIIRQWIEKNAPQASQSPASQVAPN